MPKQPLIAGWAKIILDNAPTPPFIIARPLNQESKPISVPTESRQPKSAEQWKPWDSAPEAWKETLDRINYLRSSQTYYCGQDWLTCIAPALEAYAASSSLLPVGLPVQRIGTPGDVSKSSNETRNT